MRKQFGFTMIELIVVIIILGILASYAVPKFMGIDKAARVSVVKGLLGATKSASEMVYAIAISKGEISNTAGTLNIGRGEGDDAININVRNGHATADQEGIIGALDITVKDGNTAGDFVVSKDGDTLTISPVSAKDATKCCVTYKYGSTDSRPAIGFDVSDCG